MYYTEYQMHFHTLYGQERSQEELKADCERRRKNGFFSICDAPRDGLLPQHWSVGWKWGRNGYWDEFEDYHWSGSWSADKIVCPSYSDSLCVRLRLSILGKRNKGRWRPCRWSASLGIGSGRESVLRHRVQLVVQTHNLIGWRPRGETVEKDLPIGYCKSLSDAMRRADQLDLSDAIQKVLESAYSSEQAKCFYRKTEQGWEPYLTTFPIEHFNEFSLPRGDYAVVEQDERGERRHLLNRSQWGVSGMIGKLSEEIGFLHGWLPQRLSV